MASLSKELKGCREKLQAAEQYFDNIDIIFGKEEGNPYKDAFIEAYGEDTYKRIKNKTEQCNALLQDILSDWESSLDRELEEQEEQMDEMFTAAGVAGMCPANASVMTIGWGGNFKAQKLNNNKLARKTKKGKGKKKTFSQGWNVKGGK